MEVSILSKHLYGFQNFQFDFFNAIIVKKSNPVSYSIILSENFEFSIISDFDIKFLSASCGCIPKVP